MSFLSRHRYVLVVAAVLLIIGVSGVVARLVRDPAPGAPLMIAPALSSAPAPDPAAAPVGAAAPPSISKSPVASKSPSPKPSRSPSASASARPSRSATPTATAPRPVASISARYSVQRGRRESSSVRGFGAVTNRGDAAGSWTMVLRFAPGVTITRASGAALSASGSTATFSGSSLAADKTDMFGFAGRVDSRDTPISPVSCTINGHRC